MGSEDKLTISYYLSAGHSLTGAHKIYSQGLTISSTGSQIVSASFQIPTDAHLVVPKTYTLLAKVEFSSPGLRRTIIAKGGQVRLLPKVINVVTPGFLSDRPGGYTTWNKVAEQLDQVVPEQTDLNGDVKGFVEKWSSTAGFLQELGGIAIDSESASGSPALQTIGAGLIASGKATAAANADAAAQAIVLKLSNPKSEFYVDPDLTLRAVNPQIIQLIGHSRGAAVNAAAALGLSDLGYTINQFISLDGYSTDWPGLSGLAGDIPITDNIQAAGGHVQNAVNFEVQDGIGTILPTDQYVRNYLKRSHLPADLLATAATALADAKAPDRPSPFINITVMGNHAYAVSNHLNIGQIYAASASAPSGQQYILDNFEGASGNG